MLKQALQVMGGIRAFSGATYIALHGSVSPLGRPRLLSSPEEGVFADKLAFIAFKNSHSLCEEGSVFEKYARGIGEVAGAALGLRKGDFETHGVRSSALSAWATLYHVMLPAGLCSLPTPGAVLFGVAHEVAHVKAKHGSERLELKVWSELISSVFGEKLKNWFDLCTWDTCREMEMEADHIAIMGLASSGVHPWHGLLALAFLREGHCQAAKVKNSARANLASGCPPVVGSLCTEGQAELYGETESPRDTHPSFSRRIAHLKTIYPEALAAYKEALVLEEGPGDTPVSLGICAFDDELSDFFLQDDVIMEAANNHLRYIQSVHASMRAESM